MNRSRAHWRVARHLVPLLLSATALVSCSDAAETPQDQTGVDSSELSSEARADLALVREIEDHRLLGDARLKNFLQSPRAAVAEAAVIAVGRIGDTSLTQDVVALLGARDARVRAGAALALGLLGGEGVEQVLLARLEKERDRNVRARILLSFGWKGTALSLPAVTAALTTKESTQVETAAATALGNMLRNGVRFVANDAAIARLLANAATYPVDRAATSGFALSALSGQNVALPEGETIAAFFRSPSPNARVYLARSLSVIKTPAAIEALLRATKEDRDVHARADIPRFLARAGVTQPTLDALGVALSDRAPEVVVGAAGTIGTLGAAAASLAPALGALYDASDSDWVKQTALTALVSVSIDKEFARSRVESALTGSWPLQLAAIPALAVLGSDADIAKLSTIAGERDTRLAYAAIEAIATLDPSRVTPEVKARLRGVLAAKDFETTSAVADVVVAHKWADFADDFRAIYDAFPGPALMNGRMAVLYALGTVGSAADVPLFERGLADDEQLVSQTAADAHKAITGVDVSARVRKASVVRTATPSSREVERALSSLVLLETTRGTVGIRMFRETPLSATNFVRLAAKGFYDGLPFHRVVPNFVAQGGDPRGDGFGGSDDLVREEISPIPHRRGTIGMATQGKDTASSQFFFNHGYSVHLDGRYTAFGEVVFGMDAVDRLQVGDVIKRARVF